MPELANQVAASRLRVRKQHIVDRWTERVRHHLAAARQDERPALIDDLPDLLERIANALASTPPERKLEQEHSPAAIRHARQRATQPGCSLDEVIVEYQLLHEVSLEILDEGGPLELATRDLISEAILLSIRHAASEFARVRVAATASALRETDVRFRHMIEAVKDYAIFTTDPGGSITSWNVGCTRMNHFTAEEAIGQHFQLLYPEDGRRRDEPMAHLRTAAIEGRFRGEGVRVRKTGEPFLADVSITPIYDDGVLSGFTKVVQDLTERNALMQERDLSRSDALRLRTEAEDRERFVATLTHDLRSPLATAKLSADLVAEFAHDSVKVRAWAIQLASSLERADRMVADLLDASRLHAGEALTLEFERCDLRQIADELCAELAIRHGDRFSVAVEGSPIGFWSKDGLRRLLDNLLSNAVKYGDADQPIAVGARRVDERMLLSVHNFGTIIPAEEQAKLFLPFHRARTARISGKQGWGIGLTLVKGIAVAHGGIVKAESYPQEGTTFTVDIPIDSRE